MKNKTPLSKTAAPAQNLDMLRLAMTTRFDTLSKRLKQVAQFALDNPNEMAISTIAAIAANAGVQPSTLIRFARAFDFSGFTDMQRVYQAALLESVPSYGERMRRSLTLQPEVPLGAPGDLLREFCDANIAALHHLTQTLPNEALERAFVLMQGARTIHVVGWRRSFPVAAYLAYALERSGKRAHLLTGMAGMLTEQAGLIGEGDIVIAISAAPYAEETAAIVNAASAKGVAVIALTDSVLSPIAMSHGVCLVTHDAESRGFRSLTATLCLAQTLAVGLTSRLL